MPFEDTNIFTVVPILSGPRTYFTRFQWKLSGIGDPWMGMSIKSKSVISEKSGYFFFSCIFILANALFGKRLGGRFIMVGTFGNSASTFLTDSAFNKGSVNWLRTGNWMRGCDSPWWLFKSHLWLPDLGFPVTLIKQYSSGVPNYYLTRDFTIKYPLPNNSAGQGFLIIGESWMHLSVDVFFLSLVRHHKVASAALRFHHPLWNKEAHLNGGTYDHTWSAGNPHFEVTAYWALLATGQRNEMEPEISSSSARGY